MENRESKENIKPILYIMVGVGFSGKSTLSKKIAERLQIPLVSQDALYFEKKDELNIDEDSDEQWEMLLSMCKERIKELLSSGKSVVFDNVNLKKEHRNDLKKIAEECGAKSEVIFLDTPLEVQKERQERNKITKERHDVKQEYLDEAIAQLEVPETEEKPLIFKPGTNVEEFLSNLPR